MIETMIKGKTIRVLTASAVVLMLLASYFVYLSPEADSPQVDMRVIGPGVKAVDYGETAGYLIQIRGKSLSHLDLSIVGVPEGWDASLSERMVSLENGEARVWLTVRAPSVAQAESGAPRAAAVGVRGGNATVATVTYISGHLNVIRGGVKSELSKNDTVQSGDILISQGESMLHMTRDRIYNLTGVWAGDSYLYLANGTTVGLVLNEKGVFFIVFSGKVIIYSSGGGNRSAPAGVRGPGAPIIHLDYNPEIQGEFPDRNYSAYMDISSLTTDSFFAMNFTDENMSVDVYTGEVGLNNGNESVEVPEHQAVRGEAGAPQLPDPEPLAADIIVVSGDVNPDVNIDGRDIHETPDAHHLPNVGGMDLFVVPPDRECTIITEGMGEGAYNLSINRISGNTTKVFEFSTNTTTGATDVVKLTRSDDLSVSSSEEKSYDLSIKYQENNTEEEFSVTNISLSKGEGQTLSVKDWGNLSDPEAKPVDLKEGDTTVPLSSGMTGNDVDKAKTTKESQKSGGMTLEIGIIFIVVIVIAGFVVYRLNRTSRRLMGRLKETERKKREIFEAMERGKKAAALMGTVEERSTAGEGEEEEKKPEEKEEKRESEEEKEPDTGTAEGPGNQTEEKAQDRGETSAPVIEKTQPQESGNEAESGEGESREDVTDGKGTPEKPSEPAAGEDLPGEENEDDMEELPDDEFGFD